VTKSVYHDGMPALADVLLGARGQGIAGSDADELEAILVGHLDQGRRAWPGIATDAEAFVAQLGRTLPAEATVADLGNLRAGDVYLACACAAGDERAIETFEAHFFREVDVAAARMHAPAGLADEAKQQLRRILFVREEPRPAAAGEFGGRGDLRGWVRVAAVRELLRLLGVSKREVGVGDEAVFDLLSPPGDPELAYLRDLYRVEVSAGLRAAFAGISPRDRALLRYQVVEGLSIDRIGALYGVHRATAARWLERARAGILERTRAELRRRLGIAEDEVDSILRLVESRVDVTLERVLGSGG
jgi:RNA polymerase sigma-70 factor, ECF subfamily